MDHLRGALSWHDAGMSVIPVVADGSKKPYGAWKDYQQFRAARAKVERWFKTSPDQGVGLICGEVSNGLEMLEIEAVRMGGEYWDAITYQMDSHNVLSMWESLISRGYTESTPSGGIHILYRIVGEKVPGNTKIATDVTGRQTYAETRGEGGFVVVAPSSGRVHKTGQAWTVLSGKIGEVPEMSWETRCKIHEALRVALDERVMPTYERPAVTTTYDKSQGERPGDAFENDPSITVHDILLRNGWKYLGKSRGQDRYVHPLSSDMSTHSACTGHNGSPNLYAWSGLPREDYYTKFGLLAHLEFNGDFSAAGKWLHSQGYGTGGTPVVDISDWDIETAPAVAAPVVDGAAPVADTSVRIEQFSEKGVGRYAGNKLKGLIRYVEEEKGWRTYADGVWRKDQKGIVGRLMTRVSDVVDDQVNLIVAAAERAVEEEASDAKDKMAAAVKLQTFAKNIASDRGIKAITNLSRTVEGVNVSATEFDTDLTILPMANGTFDLDSMTLREHRPTDMVTKSLGFAYNPDAVATRWLRYLEEVLPDAAYRDYLQRAVGMALLGDTSEAAFFVLWGETGCGKSQFLEVMKAMFGEYGITAAPTTFQDTPGGDGSRKSNSLHQLRGARYVSTSETKERSSLSSELVKRVTGGDTVTSHALYETEVSWKPVFTMFMGTNFKPNLDASDGAIWRRVKPIKFPRSFFENNQPTSDREKGLAERIIATELAGVFNWALDGVRAYRAIGLKDPDGMQDAVKEYREESDPVLSWLNEAVADTTVILAEDATATTTELYRLFANESKDNGIRFPVGKNKFSASLEKLGYPATRGAGGVRMRKGLKVNANKFNFS